ncbi:MAG: FG-GAP repeat protein, partial [Fibrobacteres bacterium]|nr:FG-GAP repeat protein [Fibrobacterota bacterium]
MIKVLTLIMCTTTVFALTPQWIINGPDNYCWFGKSLAAAGDLNDDGFLDILCGISAVTYTVPYEGAAVAFFGSDTGPSKNFSWFVRSGQSSINLGNGIGASDVNGDGHPDVLVGAPGFNGTGEGNAYLFSGSSIGLPTPFSSYSWSSGSQGKWTGFSVGNAGDVNRDGFGDMFIAVDNPREIDVYYGSLSGLPSIPNKRLPAFTDVDHVNGPSAVAVDFNTDGYTDLLVTNVYRDVEIFYGGPSGISNTPGWKTSNSPINSFGSSIASLGDINGDGQNDIMVGDYQKAWIYFGGTSPDTIVDQIVTGSGDFGTSVAGIGDFNGDGIKDAAISSFNGQVIYLYLGGPHGLRNTPSDSYTVETGGYGAIQMAGVGDINKDGRDDFIASNPTNGGGGYARGQVYFFQGMDKDSLPVRPYLLYPANNGDSLSGFISFGWKKAKHAVNYTLEVSEYRTFTPSKTSISGITDTTYTLGSLSANKTYYWRTCAIKNTDTSVWSIVDTFTTRFAPPAQSSPSDGALNSAVSLTFSWGAVSGATQYGLQVSTDSTFASTVYSKSDIATTSQLVSGLSNSTVYYWRVNASSGTGGGKWSAFRKFTTIVAAPSAPTVTTPTNNSTNQALDLTLTWSSIGSASSYRYQVATDSFFTTIIDSQSELSLNTVSITGLLNDQQYYTRVNASNIGGTSSWSTVSKFKTIIANPSTPSLIIPLDYDTLFRDNIALKWYVAEPNVEKYAVEISDNASMSPKVVDTLISDTAFFAASLTHGNNYWWRAKAWNIAGYGNYSTVRSFYVKNRSPLIASISDADISEGDTLKETASATDPDGDGITYTWFVNGSSHSTGASLILPTIYTDSGVKAIMCIVSDGSLNDTAFFTLHVTNVNRAPILNNINDSIIFEGDTLRKIVVGSDPDGDSVVYSWYVDGSYVSTGYTLTMPTSYNDSGSVSVSCICSDGSLKDTVSFSIKITNVNRPPFLSSINDTSMVEGGTITFVASAIDPDGDAVTYSWNMANPFTASYSDSGNKTVVAIASDGLLKDTATFTVHINNVNRPPVVSSIANKAVGEGDTLNVTASANDPDDDNLTYSWFVQGSAYSIGPNLQMPTSFSDSGQKQIMVIVSDGSITDTAIFFVLISNSNRPPVFSALRDTFVYEGSSIGFRSSAVDPDDDVLTYAWYIDGIAYIAGDTISIVSTYSDSGVRTLSCIATDGSLQDTVTFMVTIKNTNRPPVLNAIRDTIMNEGETITILTSAVDPDGDVVTYFWSVSNPYTASYADSGNKVVSCVASDGDMQDTVFFNLYVQNMNRAPVVNGIVDKNVNEGDTVKVTAIASDPDGDMLTYSWLVNGVFYASGVNLVLPTSYVDSGVKTVIVTATDGTLSGMTMFMLRIGNKN